MDVKYYSSLDRLLTSHVERGRLTFQPDLNPLWLSANNTTEDVH